MANNILDHEILINNSGVRDIFTPYEPISKSEKFRGRYDELRQIISAINNRGQHILLYGDRGVGKTSLAMSTHSLLKEKKAYNGKFITKRCDSGDNFGSIVKTPLEFIGINLDITEKTRSHKEGGNAGLDICIAKAGLNSEHTKSQKIIPVYDINSPAWVAQKLKDFEALFLIDEADALSDKNDRRKIAELIKQLSDTQSRFKVMVVGISETGGDLTAGHLSAMRCLKEIHLGRMKNDEILDIIREGMQSLKLKTTSKVEEKIIDMSAGYPYFTHLICLKCAEIVIAHKVKDIYIAELEEALEDAVKESENSLSRSFKNFLRPVKNEAEYRSLMLAASYCPIPEFSLNDVRQEMSDRFPIEFSNNTLGRYMKKLTNDQNGILTKKGRGIYKFSDPMMPSFIKMIETYRQREELKDQGIVESL